MMTMMMMTQAERASEALRMAADGGFLRGSLTPGMFGCPGCHTAWIVASTLPLGRCGHCGTQMTLLDAHQIQQATLRRTG